MYYSDLSGHVPLPPSKSLERASTVMINHKFQKAGDTLQTLRLINLTFALATAFSTASFFCSSNCFMSCALVVSNATLISSLCFAFHSCRAISTATAKYSPQKRIEFRLYLTDLRFIIDRKTFRRAHFQVTVHCSYKLLSIYLRRNEGKHYLMNFFNPASS